MTIADYLRFVGKFIPNWKLRKEVLKEIQDHIEDCRTALVESGMPPEKAEKEALHQMGDPAEIGLQMRKVYRNLVDLPMIIWMLGAGCFIMFWIALCTIFGFLEYDNALPFFAMAGGTYEGGGEFILHGFGFFVMILGFILSINEVYKNKPLFYAYAANWKGGYIYNSGLILILSTVFFASNAENTILWILGITAVQTLLRMAVAAFRIKKEENVLWQVGIAATDIFKYKGKGNFNGKKIKVVSKEEVIPKDSIIMIVAFENGRPIVETLQ